MTGSGSTRKTAGIAEGWPRVITHPANLFDEQTGQLALLGCKAPAAFGVNFPPRYRDQREQLNRVIKANLPEGGKGQARDKAGAENLSATGLGQVISGG